MDEKIEQKIGSNIRRLRRRAGLTQEQFSTKMQLLGCDITRSTLAKIEVGQRHLYPDEIVCVRAVLGTTYEEILETR